MPNRLMHEVKKYMWLIWVKEEDGTWEDYSTWDKKKDAMRDARMLARHNDEVRIVKYAISVNERVLKPRKKYTPKGG